MTKQIDLNADLGEGCAFDAELMSVVTSCNIACGGHAGDEASIKQRLLERWLGPPDQTGIGCLY